MSARDAIRTTPTSDSAYWGDVRGYTDEALEVLRSTSTVTAGTATIKSPAQRFKTRHSAQFGFNARGDRSA
jgi:hypothetical protein